MTSTLDDARALFEQWGSTAEVLYSRPDPLADLLPLVDASTLAEPLESVQWLARSLALARGRPLLVSGYGGAGKTWAVLELALLVAAGEKRFWGGVDLELAGPVLHIDFEMGLQALKWRIQRLAYGRGIDLASLGARLQVSSLPKLTLTDPRAEEVLLRACEGKALVVIDNNAAGSRGVDENSAEAAETLYMLNRVSETTKAVVIVLAHEAKDEGRTASKRIRGSSAIHAAVGGGVAFSSPCKGVYKGEPSKASLGPEPEPFYFSLEDCGPVDPATSKPCGIRLCPVDAQELAQKLEAEAEEREAQKANKPQRGGGVPAAKLAILQALKASGPMSRTEALSLVGGKNETKADAWNQLLDEGAVKQIGNEGRKQLFDVVRQEPASDATNDDAMLRSRFPYMPVSYNTQPALPPNRPPRRRVFPGAAGGSYYPLLKEGISRKPLHRTPERPSPVDGEGGAGRGRGRTGTENRDTRMALGGRIGAKMTTGKGEQTKRPHRAGSDEVKDSLPRSQTRPSGPVRWRVDIAGCEPDLYNDRRKASAAAKRARLKGCVVTLTRIEAVSRRWRCGDLRCYVWRDSLSRGWSWSAGLAGAGWRETYDDAVEAAERASRGQR